MNINERSIFKKTVILLAVLNLAAFFIYHLTTYTVGGTVAAFIFYYFHEAVEFCLPLIAALSLYATYLKRGNGAALLRALPYSLTFLLFLFPYNAFTYAYEGIEIGGVMLFASLSALFSTVVIYIETVVLFLLISLVSARLSIKRGRGDGIGALDIAGPFDLDSPINCGILSAAGAMFIYKLVYEVIDTVNYLIDYSGTYLIGEIIYMVFRYIFLLILALGAHALLVLIKNKAQRCKESAEEF